jgi:O-antigen ligase
MPPSRQQTAVAGLPASAQGTMYQVAEGQTSSVFADAWETHPVRKVSVYFCLATLFLRLSVLPELILYTTHVNTYLLYVTAPPAILSALLMGSVRRTFRSRAAYYWLAFFLWFVLATPFSSWVGGSIGRVITYARVDGMFLVLIGGLAVDWREVRALFRTIAAAALVNLASARIFANFDNGRLSLAASGTIGNSNDLAAQLLLVLPFLLFFMLGRRRSFVIRIAVIGLLLDGLWVILGTASRGALVGLAVVFLCILVHLSLPKKLALVAAVVLLVLAAMTLLPTVTRGRLGSLFGTNDVEAAQSAESRQYLFWTSVRFTFQHPVFGVGPDQFGIYEGKTSRAHGEHGNWHATHNSYTQVSSECGLPAFFFFVGGLGSAILLVLRTYRMAKREGYPEIANACFCYLLSMAGYLVALIFLAQAYSFRLPAMVGVGITLSFAAMRTMRPGPVQGAAATPESYAQGAHRGQTLR